MFHTTLVSSLHNNVHGTFLTYNGPAAPKIQKLTEPGSNLIKCITCNYLCFTDSKLSTYCTSLTKLNTAIEGH